MRTAVLLFSALLALTPAFARMGDSTAQSLYRYGQPSSSTGGEPGQLTSTKTFQVSGLTLVCGYLKGLVAMEAYTVADRDFLPAEVEALLRTDSQKRNWSPPGPYAGTMTYTRADGATAKLTGNKLEIYTPAWSTALAQDAATAKANADEAASSDTNAAPESTNAAETSGAATNVSPEAP